MNSVLVASTVFSFCDFLERQYYREKKTKIRDGDSNDSLNASYSTSEDTLLQLRCRFQSCFIYLEALQMHSKDKPSVSNDREHENV